MKVSNVAVGLEWMVREVSLEEGNGDYNCGSAPLVLNPVLDAGIKLQEGSTLAERALAVIEHFDIPLPLSNPRMIECFRVFSTAIVRLMARLCTGLDVLS